MKAWAQSKGVTHFTHWFQPLSGATAEKHDGFFNKAEEWLKKQEAKEKGESPTLPTTNSNSERLELPKED